MSQALGNLIAAFTPGLQTAFSALDPLDSNLTDDSTPDPAQVTQAYQAGAQGGGSYNPTVSIDNSGDLSSGVNDVSAGLGELLNHPIKWFEDLLGINTSSTSIGPFSSTVPTNGGGWGSVLLIGGLIVAGIFVAMHYAHD